MNLPQQNRCKKLLQSMDNNSVALIWSAKLHTRSNDTHYPFRQNSHFYYLTGLLEPDSLLVLSNHHQKPEITLFVRPKNEREEMWEGKRLGPKGFQDKFNLEFVFGNDELEEKLPKLLQGHEKYYAEKKDQYTKQFQEITPLLGRLRLIKDEEEIKQIKEASRISDQGHEAAMIFAKPGKTEAQVQHAMEYIFKKEGSSHIAYDSIVAGGNNATVLHYTDNNDSLEKDSLLLIDAGAELNCYASDITRTFPVSGKFNSMQADIYDLVLEAQEATINAVNSHTTLKKLHEIASRRLAQGLLDLKILRGSIDEILENKTLLSYYPHGTGHWLGLDVHDPCPYLEPDGKPIVLQPGMIFTIEPGLYFSKERNEKSPYSGIGIRIEDDILVTSTGCEVLSKTPKKKDQLELLCQQEKKFLL